MSVGQDTVFHTVPKPDDTYLLSHPLTLTVLCMVLLWRAQCCIPVIATIGQCVTHTTPKKQPPTHIKTPLHKCTTVRFIHSVLRSRVWLGVGTEYHTVDRLRNVYSTSHLLHYRLSMERLPPVGQRMHGNRRSDGKRIRALGFADVKRHQSAFNRRASKVSPIDSPSPVKKIFKKHAPSMSSARITGKFSPSDESIARIKRVTFDGRRLDIRRAQNVASGKMSIGIFPKAPRPRERLGLPGALATRDLSDSRAACLQQKARNVCVHVSRI